MPGHPFILCFDGYRSTDYRYSTGFLQREQYHREPRVGSVPVIAGGAGWQIFIPAIGKVGDAGFGILGFVADKPDADCCGKHP